MFLTLLVACEKDSLPFNESVLPVFNPLDCLQQDCATGTNSLVQLTLSSGKSVVPLTGIQRAYHQQYLVEEHLERLHSDGYPAWDALVIVDVNEDYRHYLVPVYKSTSDRVEAVISVIHYLGQGMAMIDYLERDRIGEYISYYDSVLASKDLQELGDSKFTREAVTQIYLALDYRLFGYYHTDVVDNLSPEARQDFSAKDCHQTILYVTETVWYTSAGGNVVDISSTYTFTSETHISDGIGCGGGNPPSGPGGVGSNGGGGTGGSTNGSGTVVIRDPDDPNNRCIEDGVGCEEEEEEEEFLRINNAIDKDKFPCAWEVVNELLGVQANSTDHINIAINEIFNNSDNVNIVIRSHPNVSSIPGVPPGAGNLAGFYRTVGTNVLPNGDLFLSGVIYLNEGHIGCTKDYIRGLVMHEALHGYIEYQRRFLSASDFQRDFPLFSGGSEDPEHEAMANRYIDNIRSVITSHNQPLSDFMVDLIAWSGLQETDAYTNWKNRLPYGPSFSAESIQGAMNTFSSSSSTNCGNGLPDGENLGNYDFDTCN